VISKVSGWLTVDPETLSRKNAIEKDQKINIRNTSKAAPQWMINDKSRDEERFRLFKPTPVVGHNVNIEPKRVVLLEANPPKRTIFNGGFSRLEDASTSSKRATLAQEIAKPHRFMQWEEDTSKQRFDRGRLTDKITTGPLSYRK